MRKTKVYSKTRIERTTERMQRRVEEEEKLDYYLKLWDIAVEALPPNTQEHTIVILERIEKIAQKSAEEAQELFNELTRHGMIEETFIDGFYRLTLIVN